MSLPRRGGAKAEGSEARCSVVWVPARLNAPRDQRLLTWSMKSHALRALSQMGLTHCLARCVIPHSRRHMVSNHEELMLTGNPYEGASIRQKRPLYILRRTLVSGQCRLFRFDLFDYKLLAPLASNFTFIDNTSYLLLLVICDVM